MKLTEPSKWRLCACVQVDENRVAGALRSACAALVAKNNTMFRAAGVAVWETRIRVPGGAWRLLTYCPTGKHAPQTMLIFVCHDGLCMVYPGSYSIVLAFAPSHKMFLYSKLALTYRVATSCSSLHL